VQQSQAVDYIMVLSKWKVEIEGDDEDEQIKKLMKILDSKD
jgi:hypothetical protein